MTRWAMPIRTPITEREPLTHAVSTLIRCGCGSIDRIDTKDLIEHGYKCECGRTIPARGNVFALNGLRDRKRMSGCSKNKPLRDEL